MKDRLDPSPAIVCKTEQRPASFVVTIEWNFSVRCGEGLFPAFEFRRTQG
jgi:hypothetical protein